MSSDFTSSWRPEYIIKSYPELSKFFTRGENRLLAYLHNWSAQLYRKGNDGEWVMLTQQQIAEAIEYSASSVRRLVKEINRKCKEIAIAVRKRKIWVTKNFFYTVHEYNIDWPKVLEISHRHFERGGDRFERGGVQDERTYKDPFKDPVNSNTPLPPTGGECPEQSSLGLGKAKTQQPSEPVDKTTLPGITVSVASEKVSIGDRSSAAEKNNMQLDPSVVLAMGLIKQTNTDGTQCYVPNPAGRSRRRQSWVEQGIALGFWQDANEGFEFNNEVIRYARAQSWCHSPLDYAAKIIRGLLAGDDPKADRMWDAWRNGMPIGWENQFEWEIAPGVISPGFQTWVETDMHDTAKGLAENTAAVGRAIKFNAKSLWERYQRVVAREVEVAQDCDRRGQTYVAPGALLPRQDQPTAEQTWDNLDYLQGRSVAALTASPAQSTPQLPPTPPEQPEITIEEFAQVSPEHADIIAKMRRIAGKGEQSLKALWSAPPASEAPAMKEPPPPIPTTQARLIVQLLPEVNLRRKQLEQQYKRSQPPCNLAVAAKYLVWQSSGTPEMQEEASNWLAVNAIGLEF